MFLVTIAGLYHKVLEQLEADEAHASSNNEMLAFELGAMENVSRGFKVNWEPSEWRKMTKAIVKAEVHNSNNSLQWLVSQMHARQTRWVQQQSAVDLPRNFHAQNPGQEREPSQEAGKKTACVQMVDEVQRIVNSLSFD